MGAIAVANRQISLNHYLIESPSQAASSLRRKALSWSVLEKICWVAIVAITAVVLTISYSGIVLTGSLPFVVGGIGVVAIGAAFGVSKFRILSDQYSSQYEIEHGVERELNAIANWTTPQIQQFLQEERLDVNQIPLDALKQKEKDEPLRALLPLIARFKYYKSVAEDLGKKSREDLGGKIEERIRNKEIQDGKPTPEDIKRRIRLINRQIAWERHELGAIPKALEGALLLNLMQMPTLELSLSDLGECRAKSFEERMFDRIYEPRNDDYFVFHANLNRAKLSLTEIEQNMEPRALRIQLFPGAPRV